MRRSGFLVATFAALALALTPTLADAAAGRGSSMGSRGSRTYTAPPTTNTAPSTAAPMQRSTAQPSAPVAGAAQPSRGGLFGGGLMGGLMGGLLGAGLFGMLFGSGMFAGLGSFMGVLGLLLQIALVVFAVRFAVRWFMRSRQPVPAQGPSIAARSGLPGDGMMGRGGAGGGMPMGAASAPIAIQPADFQAFEQLLKSIQAAWSAGDEGALRAFTTPEMASYFGEQLSDMARLGQRNEVTDVRLEQGDLAEAWAENGREYATVAMRFSALDVTRDAAGRVVQGDAATRTMTTEVWTFVRMPGQNWVLSAIQQTM